MTSSSWTIDAVLRRRASETPDGVVYRFYRPAGGPLQEVTYQALHGGTQRIAGVLREAGRARDRVLIALGTGPEFVETFFACLYAGMIPVPCHPPGGTRLGNAIDRLQRIAASARPACIVSSREWLARLAQMDAGAAGSLGTLRRIAVEDAAAAPCVDGPPVESNAGGVALLQYTSGSTAQPKGVVVTHANLMANEGRIQRAFGVRAGAEIVSWLPLFHDMGLIGSMLQPIFSGATATMMSAADFVRSPATWLQLIDTTRASISGGPNFAYELCAGIDPDTVGALDLGAWSTAFCGAEPIRADTLDRFARRFERHGFRRQAFFPCYGLAESTLLATSADVNRGATITPWDRDALAANRAVRSAEQPFEQLVSCGRAFDEREIAIVGRTGERLPDRHVGEIWLRGESVARGYWEAPQATLESFGAATADGDGPFLRTGDLGFMDDGELYVVGRLKDLIVIRGRNIHPQDIEDVAQRSGGRRPTVAFQIDRADGAGLVIVQESDPAAALDLAAMADDIHRSVAGECGVAVEDIVFVAPKSVTRTTSGKLERYRTRQEYVAGSLAVRGRFRHGREHAVREDEAPMTPLVREVTIICERVLGVTIEDPRSSLFALGVDSLAATRLLAALEQAFGVCVPIEKAFEDMSPLRIARLADDLLARQPACEVAGGPRPTSAAVERSTASWTES